MIKLRLIAPLATLLLHLTHGEPGAAVRPIEGVLHPRLRTEMTKAERVDFPVWIFFADKGPAGAPDAKSETVTDRARARRAKTGFQDESSDRPIYADYLSTVEQRVTTIRTRNKWLNGVSAVASRSQIEEIAALPFVIRVQEIARGPQKDEQFETGSLIERGNGSTNKNLDIDYGLAEAQLAQINVPGLHEECLTGKGVHILMNDSGFYPDSRPFAMMDIAATRDFVNGGDDVTGGGEGHGTSTLSVIGGYDPGFLVGPAFEATYYLARTEDIADEYVQEEDFWAAAVAWGESLGVDIVSSSVGYIDWYTYQDMDGQTAIITLAAEAAIARGVTVVNSAGNEGNAPWHYMIAPADGENVLSIGGVTINGTRSSFSSFGPTFDGRVKPDVSALASSVALVSNPRVEVPYGASSGTSFSCPLVAGVVALLIQHDPTATPGEIADALRATASQATAPDTSLGYGIVDAVAAAENLGPYRDFCPPVIAHDPPEEVPLASWPPSIRVDVSDDFAIDSVFVMWSEINGQDGGFFPLADIIAKSGLYSGTFPGEGIEGNEFGYNITAIDAAGNRMTDPPDGGSYMLRAGGLAYGFTLAREGEGATNPFELGRSGAVYQVFFDLPKQERVSLIVYDIAGRVVREIVDREEGPGAAIDAVWNLKNEGGEDVGPGVYFLRFEAGPFEITEKIVLLR